MKHFAKECRASIEVITPNTAQCRICGQTYKRSRNYGKDGWQRKNDDNRLLEYIKDHKDSTEEANKKGG